MEREKIMEVVKKHLLSTLEETPPGGIDPTKSMKDYGASSLDIVEVVSSSMRELKIKIPRKELAGIKDINGLVDMLSTHSQPT